MKNGNRKRRKTHHPARSHARTDPAEPQQNHPSENGAEASRPWLRILSSDGELDPHAEGLFALANGRRRSGEPDPRVSKGSLRRH